MARMVSFLTLIFFDLLFQTSKHQNAEGTLIPNDTYLAMNNFLTPWQEFALHATVASLVTSLIVIWILGVIMWMRGSKKN